jgi:hypothetical protein
MGNGIISSKTTDYLQEKCCCRGERNRWKGIELVGISTTYDHRTYDWFTDQLQISSTLLHNTTTAGYDSVFSVHISRVPLQDICRMGPRFSEETQNWTEACGYKIYQQ